MLNTVLEHVAHMQSSCIITVALSLKSSQSLNSSDELKKLLECGFFLAVDVVRSSWKNGDWCAGVRAKQVSFRD